MLDPNAIADLVNKANEQGVSPEVKKEQEQNDAIQLAKEPEYKTPEQERAEAVALLDAKLGIKAEEQQEETKPEEGKTEETPEETIERLTKELEEVKGKTEVPTNPLEQVEKTIEAKGINIKELEETYVTTGELSEEQLKSLADAGFDKQAIDAYITTRVSIEENKANTLVASIMEGGRDTYNKMAEWMRENKTPEEIIAYNKGLKSEHQEVYIKHMYSEYTKSSPSVQPVVKEPTVIRGQAISQANSSLKPFTNRTEMAHAMADSRYGRDSVYSKMVRDRVALSS